MFPKSAQFSGQSTLRELIRIYCISHICVSAEDYSILEMPENNEHLKTHLALIPRFCFCPALLGNVLILSFNLSNDAIQVQVPVVVHLKDHGGIRNCLLHLVQFLQRESSQLS